MKCKSLLMAWHLDGIRQLQVEMDSEGVCVCVYCHRGVRLNWNRIAQFRLRRLREGSHFKLLIGQTHCDNWMPFYSLK